MHLVIAIDISGQLIESLPTMRQQLFPNHANVRWIRNGSLHVTLKFLRKMPKARLRPLDETIKSIDALKFQVAVTGVGFFPNGHAPRVFWAGIQSKGPVLLVNKVERHMVELGFKSERRPFHPHLTLARAQGNVRIEPRFAEQTRVWEDRKFGTFEIDRFFLYESRFEPMGIVYTKLAEYFLNTDSPGNTLET